MVLFFVRVGDGELQSIISTEINHKMTGGFSGHAHNMMICSLKILCLAVDAAHVCLTQYPPPRKGKATVET